MNRESGIHDGMNYDQTSGSPDYFIAQSGNCYSLPMIPIVPYFSGVSDHGGSGDDNAWQARPSFLKCYKAYWEWWTQDRDNFTADEFFSYGKDNDNLMERDISQWSDKYFLEQAHSQRKEFLTRFGLVLDNHGIKG